MCGMHSETGKRSAPPVAGGTRAGWADVPDVVHEWVAEALGSPVVSASTQAGGFSPGVAVRLVCADGRRAFVKAVSPDQNPDSPEFHRRESKVTGALPVHPSLPRQLASYDDGYWVAMLYEDIVGWQPVLPWRKDELDLVLGTLHELSTVLDPCPVPDPIDVATSMTEMGGLWRELAAWRPDDLDPWLARHLDRLVELASEPFPTGSVLVHLDLRADNLLITESGDVVLIDWAQGGTGPPWLDLVLLLLEVEAHGGHDVERIIADHPLTRSVDPAQLTQAVLAASGMFEFQHRRPAPPGLPTLREFQRAYALASTGWLRRRLDGVWS